MLDGTQEWSLGAPLECRVPMLNLKLFNTLGVWDLGKKGLHFYL